MEYIKSIKVGDILIALSNPSENIYIVGTPTMQYKYEDQATALEQFGVIVCEYLNEYVYGNEDEKCLLN